MSPFYVWWGSLSHLRINFRSNTVRKKFGKKMFKNSFFFFIQIVYFFRFLIFFFFNFRSYRSTNVNFSMRSHGYTPVLGASARSRREVSQSTTIIIIFFFSRKTVLHCDLSILQNGMEKVQKSQHQQRLWQRRAAPGRQLRCRQKFEFHAKRRRGRFIAFPLFI